MKILYICSKIHDPFQNVSEIRKYLFLRNLMDEMSDKIQIERLDPKILFSKSRLKEKLFYFILFRIPNQKIGKFCIKLFLSNSPVKNNFDLVLIADMNSQLLLMHPFFEKIKNKTINLSDNSIYITSIDKKPIKNQNFIYKLKIANLFVLEKYIIKKYYNTLDSDVYISHLEKEFSINHDKHKILKRSISSPFEIFKYDLIDLNLKSNLIDKVKNLKNEKDKKIVLFYANFHKMHGVEKIIDAFELLYTMNLNIYLILIGSQDPNNPEDYKEIIRKSLLKAEKLKNIITYKQIPLEELYLLIKEIDLGLGIFGNSFRSNITLSVKIADFSFMQKPFITKDSLVVKEFFSSDLRKIICSAPSSKNLALKINEFFKLSSDTHISVGLSLYKNYMTNLSFKNQIKTIFIDYLHQFQF